MFCRSVWALDTVFFVDVLVKVDFRDFNSSSSWFNPIVSGKSLVIGVVTLRFVRIRRM
jgi:hypothetical protein